MAGNASKSRTQTPRRMKPFVRTKGSISEPGVVMCAHTCSRQGECHSTLRVNVWAKAGNTCRRHAVKAPHKHCTPRCPAYKGLKNPILERPLGTSDWNALTDEIIDEIKARYGAETPPESDSSSDEAGGEDGQREEIEVEMAIDEHDIDNQEVNVFFSNLKVPANSEHVFLQQSDVDMGVSESIYFF